MLPDSAKMSPEGKLHADGEPLAQSDQRLKQTQTCHKPWCRPWDLGVLGMLRYVGAQAEDEAEAEPPAGKKNLYFPGKINDYTSI